MLLSISHTTRYVYDAPVPYGLQKMRLSPPDTPQQTVQEWTIIIDGAKRELGYRDQHGNTTELLSMDEHTTEITVTAAGTVQTNDTSGVLGHLTGPAPLWHYLSFTRLTEAGEGALALAAKVGDIGDRLELLHALSNLIRDRVDYRTGETHADVTAEEAIAGGLGVCQDHAHIFVAAARSLKIPARYVSGYLQVEDEIEHEAAHAWGEAHLPDIGWVGFDVSNRCSPDDRYVRVACGLDYRDAAPLSGLRQGAGTESLIVSLQVQQ